MMKNVEEFCNSIARDIVDVLGEEYKDCIATPAHIVKNNGVCLHGVTIKNPEYNVSPTIYVDGYYENYITLGEEVDKYYQNVLSEVKECYLSHVVKNNLDLSYISDFESVKTVSTIG